MIYPMMGAFQMSNIASYLQVLTVWLEVVWGGGNSMNLHWSLQYFSNMAANDDLKAKGETEKAEIDLSQKETGS